jgi:8-oxo-dGTP pyrophosphatase MutT (NUDIX family)
MPTTFNPQQTPPIRVDFDLPAVPVEQLSAAALRRRFLAPPAWQPDFSIERALNDREPRPASVLVPLILRTGGLTVMFTQRTDHLSNHPGQISFPGGRAEAHDKDATATALREAHEEIGLHAHHIDVLGELPVYATSSGFVITPVVALIEPPFSIEADPFEVAEVFEVPLAFLMTPANHRHHRVEFGGVQREFLSMPFEGLGADGSPRRYFIWGATAAMLRNIYRFLSA